MNEREAAVAAANAQVENALSTALQQLDDTYLVKWVVAFEYLSPTGDRLLGSLASAGLMKWDVTGMLTHILKTDELDSLQQLIRGPDDA